MIIPWAGHRDPEFSFDEIRNRARLLVIDDHTPPFLTLFKRDGYDVEHWARVEDMRRLVDGNYDLIMLDLHGVGLDENPELQGLGILEHVKHSNPTQIVVAYSAKEWDVGQQTHLSVADAVLSKGSPYLEYKNVVDENLRRRYSIGYFIAKMNEELGDSAVLAPRAVPKARRAIQGGRLDGFSRYLKARINEEATVDRAIAVISLGVSLFK